MSIIVDRKILGAKDEFVRILRKYNDYLNTPVIWQDGFTYPDQSEEHLFLLKNKYNLERYKSDNQIEYATSIMQWCFEILFFSQQSEYLGNLAALDIVAFSRKTRSTVNCAMHSIVLTEALLSVGMKARSIQCLPLDPLDIDSHWITLVYINDLGKCIALDATCSIAFISKDGSFMDLQDLRLSYIDGNEFTIKIYSRFINHQNIDIEWRLAYMAKNLFRFACFKNASYHDANNIMYYLNPNGYGLVDIEENDSENIKRYISNPIYFFGTD